MESDATFKKIIWFYECAVADFYQSLDDILSRANDDYKRGNLTLEQLAIITKMVYYHENMRPFEQ